ncbi:hypothetical protein QFZ28_003161 [Neobacillus niacini]|nr:hypothetical protein [Neobacillus niacini]MDQ1002761.1 hypothetical protein [Neobacillus niacini]
MSIMLTTYITRYEMILVSKLASDEKVKNDFHVLNQISICQRSEYKECT